MNTHLRELIHTYAQRADPTSPEIDATKQDMQGMSDQIQDLTPAPEVAQTPQGGVVDGAMAGAGSGIDPVMMKAHKMAQVEDHPLNSQLLATPEGRNLLASHWDMHYGINPDADPTAVSSGSVGPLGPVAPAMDSPAHPPMVNRPVNYKGALYGETQKTDDLVHQMAQKAYADGSITPAQDDGSGAGQAIQEIAKGSVGNIPPSPAMQSARPAAKPAMKASARASQATGTSLSDGNKSVSAPAPKVAAAQNTAPQPKKPVNTPAALPKKAVPKGVDLGPHQLGGGMANGYAKEVDQLPMNPMVTQAEAAFKKLLASPQTPSDANKPKSIKKKGK